MLHATLCEIDDLVILCEGEPFEPLANLIIELETPTGHRPVKMFDTEVEKSPPNRNNPTERSSLLAKSADALPRPSSVGPK